MPKKKATKKKAKAKKAPNDFRISAVTRSRIITACDQLTAGLGIRLGPDGLNNVANILGNIDVEIPPMTEEEIAAMKAEAEKAAAQGQAPEPAEPTAKKKPTKKAAKAKRTQAKKARRKTRKTRK